MTSRIFVDVRGDGAVIANKLLLAGYLIEEFVPRRLNKHQSECGSQVGRVGSWKGGTRCLLSADDDLFQPHIRGSLESPNDQLVCGAGAPRK